MSPNCLVGQIYGISMMSRNVMIHTIYCMHQIDSMESPINTAWPQLMWDLLMLIQIYSGLPLKLLLFSSWKQSPKTCWMGVIKLL